MLSDMGEYRLDLLGWFQFERLCQTLLTVPYGLAIDVWGGSRDWGRDAYSDGPLRFPKPGEDEPGPFLFQAKFVADASQMGDRAVTRLKAMLAAEAKKLPKLAEDGEWEMPRHYVVMTNVKVGAAKRNELKGIIKGALPAATVHLLHEPNIETMLNTAPGVRLSFPQILSLRDLSGVLEEVVNRDLANRADALLADAQGLAAAFVPTRSHHRAVETVRRHGFVVLTGPPEMGKTSIAKIIALAQASGGWDVVSCAGPADFNRAYRKDARQVFVADDAFGSTEYRPTVAEDWARALPEMLPRVGARHWLIWTSRSAPLQEGLRKLHLQGGAEGFPEPAKVIVQASDLSVPEKAMMLYRHARAAGLSAKARDLVRTHAERIVDHPHFTPLRVRRFVRDRIEQLATADADLRDIWRAVNEELAEPTMAMAQSFEALSPAARDLLISMLDVGQAPTQTAIASAYERLAGGDEAEAAETLIGQLDEHFLHPA
jgi:hypothetical protein